MENVFYIILAIAQAGVLGWYFWNSNKKNKIEKEKKESLAKEYPFEGMRNIALNSSPGAILANVPENEIYTYCVIMDRDLGNDVITLVAQVTGEANLYVKSGGGIVGAGKHANISEAAQKFTLSCQQYLQYCVPVTATPLPKNDQVQFFFLTNIGKFTVSDTSQNIENKTSPITGLYMEASNVITEMRRSALPA